MIGIIGAMSQEVAILKALITAQRVEKHMHVEFTVGQLHGKDVVLLESGIGKVNVAIATTLLLERFAIKTIINTGSAGGLDLNAEVGDIIISETVAYHDVDVTGFGYAWGQVPGLPPVFPADSDLITKVEHVLVTTNTRHLKGQIITGDVFVNRPDQMATIRTNFDQAVALEMEAAAVAQVCHINVVPFVVVRALSDIAGKESHISFDEFLPTAAKNSSKLVSELIKLL